MNTYRYLGCEIKYDEPTTDEAEINLRTDAADTKFYSLARNMMNMKINIKIRTLMLNSLVRSRLTYACEAWHLTQRQIERMSATYHGYLRKMIKGGYKRRENSWSFELATVDLLRISKTSSLKIFIEKQQLKYIAHIIRKNNSSISKRLLFNDNSSKKPGPQTTVISNIIKSERCTPTQLYTSAMERRF